jgi:hypothetical protein
MNLSIDAERLIQQLWRCHNHNPVNHFEYLPGEEGGAILHPASRERVETSAVAVDELVRAGLLRGRSQLSFTFEGIRYGQRRSAGR